MHENALIPENAAPQISVYLEPNKRKLVVELDGTATVGDVVKGMVAQLRECEAETGFRVDTYLKEKIGEGYAPEWQLFREADNCTLLPPGVLFRELTPPLGADEMFTLKVNAKVAAPAEVVLVPAEKLVVLLKQADEGAGCSTWHQAVHEQLKELASLCGYKLVPLPVKPV